MTVSYRYKKQIIISCCILIIIILSSFGIHKVATSTKKKNLSTITKTIPKKQAKKEEIVEKEFVVDIKGEIINPGIYHVKEGSRVTDVIEKAAGLTENADTTVINLSKKVIDEMVIIIYSKKEVQDFQKTKEKEQLLQEKCIQKEENAIKNDACIGKENSTTTTTKISINQATKEELMKLSGIGEAKADDIIKYREANGGFKNIEELKNIKGIGEAVFDKIKETITL